MDATMAQLELLLRGFAVGGLAVTAIGLWLSGVGRNARIAGLMFCISIMAYLLANVRLTFQPFQAVAIGLSLASAPVVGCIWLFILVVFEDRPIRPLILAPAAAMVGLSGMGLMSQCRPELWVWPVRDAMSVLLSLHALYVIARGWRGDLVEARRALRGPFLTITAGFAIIQTLIDTAARIGLPRPWGGFGNALIVAALALFGAFTFLQAKAGLFGAPKAVSNDLKAADQMVLDRLNTFMEVEEGWRRESLTIAAVALAVAAPEHRVRRLINDHMGHRNFQGFVNAYRIEAAKQALSQAGKGTIATIAFDLGFGSLGPFNRAFRAETGVSPREWRRRELADA